MKPTHYVVHWGKTGAENREYRIKRSAARGFALAKRLQGFKARIEPKGF